MTEGITVEALEERKAKLTAEFEQIQAQIQTVASQLEQLNNAAQACGGAIQDVNFWLGQLEEDDGTTSDSKIHRLEQHEQDSG